MSRAAAHLRANAVAYVALFLALSAGAYAATKAPKNSVVSKSIKNGQVKSKDLRAGAVQAEHLADGVQQVGPQGPQGPAGSPDTGVQILEKLGPVDGDGSGLDADRVDGVEASALARAGSPDWIEVGEPGAPAFDPNASDRCPGTDDAWENWNPDQFNVAGFFRDPFGVVHLKGLVRNGDVDGAAQGDCTIFTLPPGFQPARREIHLVSSSSHPEPGRVDIFGSNDESRAGRVAVVEGNSAHVSLDGITFRCGPSEEDGCP